MLEKGVDEQNKQLWLQWPNVGGKSIFHSKEKNHYWLGSLISDTRDELVIRLIRYSFRNNRVNIQQLFFSYIRSPFSAFNLWNSICSVEYTLLSTAD